MPAIVSIVGKSSSGKTTFLEKLIRELTARGYTVATIKHSHHSISFDNPKKDSYRHAQAGAAVTMVSSTTSFQIIKSLPRELSINELVRYLGEDYDLILTEGFSRRDAPKIEVHRKEAGPVLEAASNLLAIVTDEPMDTETRQFDLEDVKGVAGFIQERFLNPDRRQYSLYVNGEKIPAELLSQPIVNDFLSMVRSHLKLSKEITTFEFHYRKP